MRKDFHLSSTHKEHKAKFYLKKTWSYDKGEWLQYTNKKQVGFELSSNMHMYYAFSKHAYSFSSRTTYLFFIW